jgi:hypothetical protein
VRLCPAYPGNPRIRIEGESPPFRKGTYGLRCEHLRASKDGVQHRAYGHPSRLAQAGSHLRITAVSVASY